MCERDLKCRYQNHEDHHFMKLFFLHNIYDSFSDSAYKSIEVKLLKN